MTGCKVTKSIAQIGQVERQNSQIQTQMDGKVFDDGDADDDNYAST